MQTTELMPTNRAAKHTVQRLRSFYNHQRRSIMLHLINVGTQNVTDLMIHFRTSQSQMSCVLNDLYKQGLLTKERQGKEMYYYVQEDEIEKICQAIEALS